jgi:hypothetical protein
MKTECYSSNYLEQTAEWMLEVVSCLYDVADSVEIAPCRKSFDLALYYYYCIIINK